jgi:hypothetical protein
VPASGLIGGQDGGGTRRPEGLGKVGKRRARVGEGGGTCKKIIPAWLDGRHHQRRRRGGSVRASRFPLARRAGGSLFSPWSPRAVVQALVKKGGAACRRGGRRRRCGDVEVVEVGALDDGGVGSSHRRLRSSQRATFPRAASNSSFSPPTSPPPPAYGCVDRGAGSPEAARVGRAQGVVAAVSYSGGQRGVRGRLRCAGGPRGAPRRRP